MERPQAFTVDNFIGNWNAEFLDFPLKADDLTKPHQVFGALLKIFDRLGIDKDSVLSPPPEEEWDSHTPYYRDMTPVINMTRVVNHLVSVMPQVEPLAISVSHFLQPTTSTTHSLLLLIFNLMIFNEERLGAIANDEEDLFSQQEQVKALENRKNELLVMLNEQAEEKGKRAERLEKLDLDIRQVDEELKKEIEAYEKEKKELEQIMEENRQQEILLEQKKAQRDLLLAELAKKKKQRVYDAEDVRAKVEKSIQNDKEVDEKLSSLKANLMEKENCVKNLQALKPSLDTANNLLQDIEKLTESLKECEIGDLDTESKEGELYTELTELQATLSELQSSRLEATEKRKHNQTDRQKRKGFIENSLREADEKEKTCRKQSEKAAIVVEQLKSLTDKYEREQANRLETIAGMEKEFVEKLSTFEDALLKKVTEVQKRIEEQVENRRKPK